MAGISRVVSKELGNNLIHQIAPQLARDYFDKFPNYYRMLEDAKSKARRSVLIDHNNKAKHIDLRDDNLIKNVERVYSIDGGSNRMSLIEFNDEQVAESIITQAQYTKGHLPIPMRIIRYTQSSANLPLNKQNLPFPIESVHLQTNRELSSDNNLNSYTDLIESNLMSLINFKLRLITLVNLERILCAGIFEAYQLLPFGSSVIDLACDSGDLDIVVTPKQTGDDEKAENLGLAEYKSFGSRLRHFDKRSLNQNVVGTGETMSLFDQILKRFAPLTDDRGVLFLRSAKVPIIKFKSRVTAIDCDLSFNLGLADYLQPNKNSSNATGIVMAQILYSLCRSSNLFVAITIYLRIFAKLVKITSKEPNSGMTNFQYLSLIMFYLQQVSLVPDESRSAGLKLNVRPFGANQLGQFFSEPEMDCQNSPENPIVPPFKDLLNARFNHKCVNLSPEQIEELLPEAIVGFMRFYLDFDFTRRAINLYNSKAERRYVVVGLTVMNPLDMSQNICHNVSNRGLRNFRTKLKDALDHLEKIEEETPLTLINALLLSETKK